MAECAASVVYRGGPLTVQDYDEAILALQAGRAALLDAALAASGCGICGGDCHPSACHHNPLVMARVGAECSALRQGPLYTTVVVPIRYFQCFHCDFVPTTWGEAADHFGPRPEVAAACLRPGHLLASARRVLAGSSRSNGEAKSLARQVVDAFAAPPHARRQLEVLAASLEAAVDDPEADLHAVSAAVADRLRRAAYSSATAPAAEVDDE
jgi:hypothetical protein